MGMRQIINTATQQMEAIMGKHVSSVTEITHQQNGWHLLVEFIERKAIPDTQDILGVYEILVEPDGEITHYERIRTRRRMDLEDQVE